MGVCECDECLNWTFKDGDVRRPGRLLDDRTIWGHKYAQREKRKLEGGVQEVPSDDFDDLVDKIVSCFLLNAARHISD